MQTPRLVSRVSLFAKAIAVMVLVGGLVMIAASVADGRWSSGHAPFPFVHRDVALVHLLCAIPLSMSLTTIAMRQLPAALTAAIAALALGAALLALMNPSQQTLTRTIIDEPLLAVAFRAIPAIAFVAAVAMAISLLSGGRRRALFPLSVSALLLVAAPWLHVAARSRHDAARLGEYLDAGRYGEAHVVAKDLVVLDPGRQWRGRALREIAGEIGVTVRTLESQVAEELPPNASLTQRVNRARLLAMLGRTEEAIELLDSLPGKGAFPPVESLRGTIFETREDWENGLAAYGRAQVGWRDRPASPEQHAELARATKGVAYCRRKLGRYAEAEASYLEMLELAPTADSHFLLAQFYEDTQQASKAREHARKAMSLAPDRYDVEGRRLINKLMVHHFGCLGVYNAEHPQASGSP